MSEDERVARRIVVVGTGLIGTSIALAMRERGAEVLLTDRDSAALALAVELGAGRRCRTGRTRSPPTWRSSRCRKPPWR